MTDVDNTTTKTMPGHDRPILNAGLLRCCLRAVRSDTRVTKPGDRLRCQACASLMVVNAVGHWAWLPEK